MDITEKYAELEKSGTREEREKYLGTLTNQEIDEIIKEPSIKQRKIYLSTFKKRE